jgi:ankyrin repeat protein
MTTAALLAAALAAGLPARAQQQEPVTPIRVLEDLGGAILGVFESIFGKSEGALPDPRPDSGDPTSMRNWKSEPEPQAQQAQPAQASPQAAPRAEAPAGASPSAQAVPQSLHSAIARGDYGNAMKMIEQGADIEAKDPGAGASALHYAVMKGEMPMVGLLIQRGADVNSRTKSGTTPLHTAVLYNRFEVAEYLIEKGSEVNAKSTSGATPLSLALAARYQRLEKLLRGKGAQ